MAGLGVLVLLGLCATAALRLASGGIGDFIDSNFLREPLDQLPAVALRERDGDERPIGEVSEIEIGWASEQSTTSGSVDGRSFKNPLLVDLSLEGGPAETAIEFGMLSIDRALASDGSALDLLDVSEPSGDVETRFVAIDRDEQDFFRKRPVHPAGGIGLSFRFQHPGPGLDLGRLSGSLELRLLEPGETLELDDLGRRLAADKSIRLEHPRLEGRGTFALTVTRLRMLELRVERSKAEATPFSAALLLADGQRRPFERFASITNEGVETLAMGATVKEEELEGSRFVLSLEQRGLKVPFDLGPLAGGR